MATRCMLNQTDCGLGLGCGGKSFLECGGYSCSKQICLDSFSQYIQNNENSALEEWNYIDGEILSFQILGSGFGYLIPWNVLGSASLIASSRADAQNQKWTALVSAAMYQGDWCVLSGLDREGFGGRVHGIHASFNLLLLLRPTHTNTARYTRHAKDRTAKHSAAQPQAVRRRRANRRISRAEEHAVKTEKHLSTAECCAPVCRARQQVPQGAPPRTSSGPQELPPPVVGKSKPLRAACHNA